MIRTCAGCSTPTSRLPLRDRFSDRMESSSAAPGDHQAPSVVNEMVDTSGTTFLFRLIEETGASVPDLTRAWLVAREVFDMSAFWHQVEESRARSTSQAQITLLLRGAQAHRARVRWLPAQPPPAAGHPRPR